MGPPRFIFLIKEKLLSYPLYVWILKRLPRTLSKNRFPVHSYSTPNGIMTPLHLQVLAAARIRAHMRILRGGLDAAMPQRILYQRDRRAAFQAMGCMGMSHPVRRDVAGDARSLRRRVNYPVDHRFIHAPPGLARSRSRLPGLKDITLRCVE